MRTAVIPRVEIVGVESAKPVRHLSIGFESLRVRPFMFEQSSGPFHSLSLSFFVLHSLHFQIEFVIEPELLSYLGHLDLQMRTVLIASSFSSLCRLILYVLLSDSETQFGESFTTLPRKLKKIFLYYFVYHLRCQIL